jgi:hypothetical protein
MMRSCLLMLAVYAALYYGYYTWLAQTFDPPGLYWGTGVVALLVSFCLGSLINACSSYREWSLLSAARHDLPRSDGRWTAVAGEIHPVTEPVIAPFSGEACVMCEYDVTDRKRAGKRTEGGNPGVDFTGFLMNPCLVRSRSGDVRLIGFPHLESFAKRSCIGDDAARRAYEFLTTTPFEDYSGVKLVSLFSALKDAWTDDDGLVRKNMRLSNIAPESLFPGMRASPVVLDMAMPQSELAPGAAGVHENEELDDEDLDDDDLDEDDFDDEELDDEDVGGKQTSFSSSVPTLSEQRVKVGDQVCAIGIYNAFKQGLVPGGLGADHFIKLVRGRLDQVERAARSTTLSRFFGGLIFLAIFNAATYGVTMAKRYHPSEQATRQREAFEAVEKGNVQRLAKLILRGTPVDVRDSSGRTLLIASREPDTSRWLIARGADVNAVSTDGFTPLMTAAQHGHTEIVKLLLAAKADASFKNPNFDLTALDFARRSGHEDIIALLSTAEAKE